MKEGIREGKGVPASSYVCISAVLPSSSSSPSFKVRYYDFLSLKKTLPRACLPPSFFFILLLLQDSSSRQLRVHSRYYDPVLHQRESPLLPPPLLRRRLGIRGGHLLEPISRTRGPSRTGPDLRDQRPHPPCDSCDVARGFGRGCSAWRRRLRFG